MGLDVWFRDDVIRVLTAESLQISRLPEGEYRRGREDTLEDIAAYFGQAAPQNDKVRGGEWISARPVVEAGYRTWEVLPD